MTVPSERLQQLTVLKYLAGLTTAENVAVTRGYALALGCLPQRLVAQVIRICRTHSCCPALGLLVVACRT